MPASIAQARDQMSALFKGAVDAGYPTLVVRWDDVEGQQPDDSALPWARFKIKHTTGGQTAISGTGGVNGKRRYTRGGFIVVQIFVPGGKGMLLTDELVTMILDAFEGKTTTGGLVFKNGRLQEVGQDGPYFQTNVLIDFSYDEVK